jgi:perosamine synthetase
MVQEQKPNAMKVRLSKPHLGNKQNLIGVIEDILDSGFLVQGKYVCRFEQEVAGYLGVKHGVAVSSGTAALHLSLVVLDIGPGDEVVVPAYTFPATANVVELVGAKPVLVDVDLDTFDIQVERIKEAITSKTKAIIPVHLFGNPADMDRICEISRTYGLTVIEDAAGALGSKYKGRNCGTIGTLGCFSFHPRKIITAGEGGMVVTDDDRLAERIRSFRNHGIQTMRFHHDFIAAGFNYRFNELGAALGINQMNEIQNIIEERQRLAKSYMDFLKSIPGISFQKTLPGATTIWQSFVIRYQMKDIGSILERLRKAGIEATIGTYAIHLLQFYKKKYHYKPSDYPNTAVFYSQNIALPFYNGMPLEIIEQVVATLREVGDED